MIGSKEGSKAQIAMIRGYREKIEAELAKICEDISTYLTSTSFLLLPLVNRTQDVGSLYFHHCLSANCFSSPGWATTTDTLLSLPPAIIAKIVLTSRLKKAMSDVAITELPTFISFSH